MLSSPSEVSSATFRIDPRRRGGVPVGDASTDEGGLVIMDCFVAMLGSIAYLLVFFSRDSARR